MPVLKGRKLNSSNFQNSPLVPVQSPQEIDEKSSNRPNKSLFLGLKNVLDSTFQKNIRAGYSDFWKSFRNVSSVFNSKFLFIQTKGNSKYFKVWIWVWFIHPLWEFFWFWAFVTLIFILWKFFCFRLNKFVLLFQCCCCCLFAL